MWATKVSVTFTERMVIVRSVLHTMFATAVIAGLASCASAAIIGPGATAATSGTDDGARLNVSELATPLLAGTHSVSDFKFYSTSSSGSVTPLLAVLTEPASRTYTVLWVGPAFTPGLGNQVVTDSYGAGTQQFTLAADDSVYAGFFTDPNGRVAYAGGGSTDHADSFTAPVVGGTEPTPSWRVQNLGRTYAFEVGVDAVPEPASILSLGGLTVTALLARRRRD